jgi:hypothetical protein
MYCDIIPATGKKQTIESGWYPASRPPHRALEEHFNLPGSPP